MGNRMKWSLALPALVAVLAALPSAALAQVHSCATTKYRDRYGLFTEQDCELQELKQARVDAENARKMGCSETILTGTLVGLLGQVPHRHERWSAYEVAQTDRGVERWGGRPYVHVILVAKHAYASAGHIARCVHSDTTEQQVPLANGFSQTIEVFTEDIGEEPPDPPPAPKKKTAKARPIDPAKVQP